MWFQSLYQEDPLEQQMVTTPLFLPGKFHGQRSLAGYHTWGCKDLDTTEQLSIQCCLIELHTNTEHFYICGVYCNSNYS